MSNIRWLNTFPFTTEATGTVGTGTSFPIQATRQQASGLWARVRNFTFSNDFRIIGQFGSINTFANGNLSIVSGSPTTETDLGHPTIPHSWTISDTSHFSVLNEFNYNIRADAVDDGTNVYNKMDCDPSIFGDIDSGNVVRFYFDKTLAAPGVTIRGPITGQIEGLSCDLYYDCDGLITSGGSFTGTSWSLSGILYWAHEQLSDGLPIYDTTTGLVLSGRSPKN